MFKVEIEFNCGCGRDYDRHDRSGFGSYHEYTIRRIIYMVS